MSSARARSALLIAVVAARLPAQVPDSVRHLPEIGVTVTRTTSPLATPSVAVTVVDSSQVHRGRVATGLDEALAFVPGVIAENRWNYSVDQRLSIRGFGSRANFGLRGIKVLLDGVPQTLPDGQSQLNNLDLSLVDHIEVLRGGASALYGNASGGVVSFTTDPVPVVPFVATLRGEGGSFGTSKEQLVLAGRSGTLGGTVAASQFSTDGFRQQSAAEQRRLSAAIDWHPLGATTFTLRVSSADDPRARNPGALTAAELSANPDSAAAGNIRRGADKSVTQTQLALGVRHAAGRLTLDATVFGLTRGLDNPLATPPPPPASASEGTWVGIDRRLGGLRSTATFELQRVALTAGIDAQALRDDRVNRRSAGGVPTDTLLLDQREEVSELAGFAQIAWALDSRWTLRSGVRHDANHFSVTDHLLTDGDASAKRTLGANSGDGGIAVRFGRVTVWSDIATVYETPTTTELANRPDGSGGFNPDLNPQRSVSTELGVRGRRGAWAFEAAAYRTATRDAIVPYSEVAGRSYFRNAGKTRTLGAEASLRFAVTPSIDFRATWTLTDARFTEYRVVNPGATDTLDGKRLAGIPRNVAHLGVVGRVGAGVWIDVDQSLSSSMFADDANTIPVDGWGAGVTSARVRWQASGTHYQVAPFAGVLNLFDRHYVGSVTINGSAGRVFEPAAGRTIYAGASITAR